MGSSKIRLKVPDFKELGYRKKILADSETMAYNRGYSEFEGYNKETGCIDFDEKYWNDWFSCWVKNISNRYYAYIIKIDGNIPIGEVALRYVKERKSYCVDIIIEAKYRRNGFGKQALKLLIDTSFNKLGADRIFDDFPKSRLSAEKLFKQLGFKRISDDIIELTKEDYMNLLNKNELTIKGVDKMEYKIINRESFKVIGIRRTTPYGGGTWAIVKSDGSYETMKNLSGHMCDLGLCFGFGEDGSNDYMCGIEWDKEDIPGFDSYTYPAATWLVFEANGKISENILNNVWQRINNEFLPQSKYKKSGLPTIEKYVLWSDAADTCKVEIWIPAVIK